MLVSLTPMLRSMKMEDRGRDIHRPKRTCQLTFGYMYCLETCEVPKQ